LLKKLIILIRFFFGIIESKVDKEKLNSMIYNKIIINIIRPKIYICFVCVNLTIYFKKIPNLFRYDHDIIVKHLNILKYSDNLIIKVLKML